MIAREELQNNLKKGLPSKMTFSNVSNKVVEEVDSGDENVLRLLDTNAAIKAFDNQLQNFENTVTAEHNLLDDWQKKDEADETKINLDLMRKT